MSGTETILLFVLGFALASLIALFAGRVLWTAALKAGARRLQRQAPFSLVGLQAERDRLRAENAMLVQRMGSRLEEAQLQLAGARAEISRHLNHIHMIENGQSDLRALRTRLQELELALADARALEAGLRQELAAKEDAVRKLRKKRGNKEGHTLSEPAPASDDRELRLRQRIGKLNELARAKPDPIASRLAEAERQTQDLEADLRQLESEWSTPSTPGNIIHLPNRPRDHTSATN